MEIELEEQACYIACPEKCAEELCPKCLLVLWMSKHKLTLVPQTKQLVLAFRTLSRHHMGVSILLYTLYWSSLVELVRI